MRDDVAERVVEDVPHVQLARRVRKHLEHVEVRLGQLAARRRVLDRERALGVPDGLPLLLDCLCVVRVHRSSFDPRNEKASRCERPWEAGAAVAALLPGSGKKQVHGTQCNHGFPMEPTSLRPAARHRRLRRTASSCWADPAASELAREFGTPLVVYDELTLLGQARAYREAAPDAQVVYGTKAFPSLAMLRLFAEAGLGADVSTAGELEFAQRAGIPGERLVVHGNNKEDELLRDATAARRTDRARLARRARSRPCDRRDAVPDPRHAGDRGRHPRGGEDGAPRLEVRAAARRRARGARARSATRRACTSTSARSSSTSARR